MPSSLELREDIVVGFSQINGKMSRGGDRITLYQMKLSLPKSEPGPRGVGCQGRRSHQRDSTQGAVKGPDGVEQLLTGNGYGDVLNSSQNSRPA